MFSFTEFKFHALDSSSSRTGSSKHDDMKQVMNILGSYGSADAAKGDLGLHRLIEALKHMFAERMNLGDPDFVDITKYTSEMLSVSYAKQIQQKILDNTTFPADYYMYRYKLYT